MPKPGFAFHARISASTSCGHHDPWVKRDAGVIAIAFSNGEGRPSRHSRNNKNNTHMAISGATSESRKRHEPVAQVRRSGDCLRLHHGNHRIDVCGFEPEFLFAVDLSLCQLRQVLGKALLERLP